MQDLIATIILVSAFYLWLFAPRHTAASATDPAAPVEYFPTVDDAPPAIAKPQPQTITEPFPVENFKVQPQPVKIPAMATETDLMTQSIRTLKTLAQGRVKGYSNLTKSQLSQRLAGLVPLAEL